MMKPLACLALGLAIGVACSPGGGGAPQGAAGQQEGTPAAVGAPNAGASASAATAQPAAGAVAAAAGQPGAPGAGSSTAATAMAPGAPPGGVAPPASPKVELREVIIPAGMTMTVALETPVSSDQSRVEDAVRGKVTKAIVVDGRIAVPAGSEVIGSVLEARRSGRVEGLASISFRFDRLRVGDATYTVRTERIVRQARATKGEDATKVGVGAAAGAVVGAIAGGKQGAAVGAAVGAGAGTGVVVATRGEEVHLGPGAVLTTRIDAPIMLQVPME
jgi:hypothetical protein